MTLEEKLLSGIVVGIVVWFATKMISAFFARARIEAGLLTDIKILTKEVSDSSEYIESWLSKLKAEEFIAYSANHAKDEQVLFNSLMSSLPHYFSKATFTKILRFYKSIEEYETLVSGLFQDVTIWKRGERKLSVEDIAYLSRKVDRITALSRIITSQNIKKLSDLPSDYVGKIAPKTMIN